MTSDDAIVSVTRKVLEVSLYILDSRFLFQARVLAWLFPRLERNLIYDRLSVCLSSLL